jgi:hypothetical protein
MTASVADGVAATTPTSPQSSVRDGAPLLRQKLASLSDGERRVLPETLAGRLG